MQILFLLDFFFSNILMIEDNKNSLFKPFTDFWKISQFDFPDDQKEQNESLHLSEHSNIDHSSSNRIVPENTGL